MTSDFDPHVESQIHDFLAENIHLVLGHGAEVVQREAQVAFGRIDLLCRCSRGDIVAIEVERGAADREAIGQLLAFIGELRRQGMNAHVRGVLVAAALNPAAEAALHATNDIEYFSYEMRFSFNRELASHSTRRSPAPGMMHPGAHHHPSPLSYGGSYTGHAMAAPGAPVSVPPMASAAPMAPMAPIAHAAPMHHTPPEPGAPLVDVAEHQFWRARGGRSTANTPAPVAANGPRSLVRYCPHCQQDTPMVDFTTRFRCEVCGNFS